MVYRKFKMTKQDFLDVIVIN